MEEKFARREQWLEKAVAPIRFDPDRQAICRELRAHLEDKAADLERIFPDMAREEIERRTVEDMGDATQLGQRLAALQTPWRGYLWVASRWLRAIALVVLALVLVAVLGVVWDLVW